MCRHLHERSPLVLPYLTGVPASYRNNASTKHPGCDPSRVTEVVISLTDFILKYRHLCLLQLPSSAPICLGNQPEVSSGQRKKIWDGNVSSAHNRQTRNIRRATFFDDPSSRHSTEGRGRCYLCAVGQTYWPQQRCTPAVCLAAPGQCWSHSSACQSGNAPQWFLPASPVTRVEKEQAAL